MRPETCTPELSHSGEFDFEQLLARLLRIVMDVRGKKAEIVTDVCEEIERATRAQLKISLFRPDATRHMSAFYPERPRYLIRLNDRFYGLVMVAVDPARPAERIELMIKAQIIAHTCALIFYTLETSTFFHDHYPHPEYPQTNFTKRERDIITSP